MQPFPRSQEPLPKLANKEEEQDRGESESEDGEEDVVALRKMVTALGDDC